jgi:soluble cytochrome b562
MGGSNAARILSCPASYAEQLKSPQTDVSSVYAEEGTLLHNVIASMVDGPIVNVADALTMITDAQMDVVKLALKTLNDLKKLYGGKFRVVGVEETLPLPGVTGAFGSVDLVLANASTVIVLDWKFGAGIPVKALYRDEVAGDQVNPQLAFYAVAARAKHKRRFRNRQIVLAIIQPRMPEPLDFVVTDDNELDEFQNSFQFAYLEALGKNARRAKGEHCRFASCKATCPLWTGPLLDLAVINPTKAALQASQGNGAATDYGKFLSRALLLADLAETWAAEIRKQGHVFLEDGGSIPDWKLVPKRGMRKWADEETTPAELAALGAGEEDIWTEPTLRSVAQAEKALKAKGIALPEDTWMLVSSGTTIAPAGDPRPESTHGQVITDFMLALKAL